MDFTDANFADVTVFADFAGTAAKNLSATNRKISIRLTIISSIALISPHI
ncbi:hypothetical protein [Bifidobacterium primatium]|nr:hypothetical protein [Bifidobacterium primatium]